MSNATVNNISTKAMLVDLRISRWTARKQDKRATAEVAKNNSVQSGAGRYYKSLIEGGALASINRIADEARSYHYSVTLPWLDTGPRTLKATGYFDYMAAMQGFTSRFDVAVTELVNDYPLYREEAKRLLGTLFNVDDYPEVHRLKDMFAFRVNIMPLATADDFRVELGDEVTEQVKQQIAEATRETMRRGMTEAYERVRKITQAFVDRLGQPDTVFRDSLVENARDLAAVLPMLNVTDDPHLATIADRLRNDLCGFDAEQLRKDPAARREAYQKARVMDKDIADFFGGAFQ